MDDIEQTFASDVAKARGDTDHIVVALADLWHAGQCQGVPRGEIQTIADRHVERSLQGPQ